jgi:hypothetical protein
MIKEHVSNLKSFNIPKLKNSMANRCNQFKKSVGLAKN